MVITWAAACTEESGGRWVRPGPAPCTPAATPAAAAWAPPRPSPPSPALAEGGAQPAQAPPPSPGRGVGGGAFSPAVAKVTVTSPGHRVRNVRAAVVAGKRRAGAQPGAGSEAVPGRQYALSWPAWLRASLCDSRGMPGSGPHPRRRGSARDRPPFPVAAWVPSLSTSPAFTAIILSRATIQPLFRRPLP